MGGRGRRAAGIAIGLWLLLGCAEHSRVSEPDAAAPADAGPIELPDDVAGKPCETDTDCRPGRCAGSLRLTDGRDPAPAPGGYCTADCLSDSQCGEGSECIVPTPGRPGQCIAGCTSDAECREGYACIGAVGSIGPLALRGGCRPRFETSSVDPDADVVGRGCSGDDECAGGTCASNTPLGTPFPGNYCSARCYDDDECGEGGACLVHSGSSEPGHCFQPCASPADCTREGYGCRMVGVDFQACYPAPMPLPDHTAGKPCKSEAECGGGLDTCFVELPFGSLDNFEVVPAPNGYCSQACSLDAECGAGAQCISRGHKGGMCLANCTEETDCRSGYVCVAHLRDGDPEAKVCVPTQLH